MKSKFFKIHELVPKHIFEKHGEKAWKFIDSRLIVSIDAIKEKFNKGSMTINNYFWKGDRQYSGLRTAGCPQFSETSQHALGNAIDAVFSDYDVEEIRQYIIANPEEFPYIKGLELGVSWLHIDTRNEDALVAFRP